MTNRRVGVRSAWLLNRLPPSFGRWLPILPWMILNIPAVPPVLISPVHFLRIRLLDIYSLLSLAIASSTPMIDGNVLDFFTMLSSICMHRLHFSPWDVTFDPPWILYFFMTIDNIINTAQLKNHFSWPSTTKNCLSFSFSVPL
uniref:Uncharacterized protein n=1 Tax=Opuntia streptacantha TaxID=393608 RepID=A0A7C9EMR4_OPUST